MTENNIGFNTDYCGLSKNKNMQITYVPKSDTESYTYSLYKNSELVRTITVTGDRITNIYLDSTGKYSVSLERFLQDGTVVNETSCVYTLDKEKPILTVPYKSLNIVKGKKNDILAGVTASDNMDGDLSGYVITNVDKLNINSLGKKQLVYTVTDKAGNSTSENIYINVIEDPGILFIFQSLIAVVIMFCLAYIIRYRRTLNLERRIEKYSISPLVDDSSSVYDGIKSFFIRLFESFGPQLKKSVFLTNLSKRYEKYCETFGLKDSIDFIAIKIISSVFLLFISICSKAVQFRIISFYEIWIPLLIGFFLPNLLFISKYKLYRYQIENDLLQAIVIMNNAFKSGKSITQAIYLVTTELSGPIAKEFNKMYTEINLGLDIEDTFKRLSKRLGLEEITYLTASLSIINKTGGNIIKVFDSIERTLMNKKKLRLELSSLTGGSKIIVDVLCLVPILFILFISLVSPNYFLPLISNPFGILLSILIVLFYIGYIMCIRWLMKVRM